MEEVKPTIPDPSVRIRYGPRTITLIRKARGLPAFFLVDESKETVADKYRWRYVATGELFEKLWKFLEELPTVIGR